MPRSSHPPRLNYSNNTWRKVQIMNRLYLKMKIIPVAVRRKILTKFFPAASIPEKGLPFRKSGDSPHVMETRVSFISSVAEH
jgi:hypothetical protein